MKIDNAKPEDIPALVHLLAELFMQEVEFASDGAAQRAGLSAIITNPEAGLILVARDGMEIVGMANLLFTISTALGGGVAILDDFVVATRARGSGVGSRLLEEAIAVVRAKRFFRIALMTDAENIAAQRLYARFGFVASSMLPMQMLVI